MFANNKLSGGGGGGGGPPDEDIGAGPGGGGGGGGKFKAGGGGAFEFTVIVVCGGGGTGVDDCCWVGWGWDIVWGIFAKYSLGIVSNFFSKRISWVSNLSIFSSNPNNFSSEKYAKLFN